MSNAQKREAPVDGQGFKGNHKTNLNHGSDFTTTRDQIVNALYAIPANMTHDEWVRVGMALHDSDFDLSDEWLSWSSQADNFNERVTRQKWSSFRKGGAVKLSTIFWMAKQNGWTPRQATKPIERRQFTCIKSDQAQRHTELNRQGVELWESTLEITPDSVAGQYLLARGCVLPDAYGDLRWLPEINYSGYRGPAMVGLMTEVKDFTKRKSLHLTAINADGKKAEAWHGGRKYWAGHETAGSVVRLWPEEAVCSGLGLAEGIETALTLGKWYAPVWASTNASLMGSFPLLGGLECLQLAVDHDDAGFNAAQKLTNRYKDAGLRVEWMAAEIPGFDVNDGAQKSKGGAA